MTTVACVLAGKVYAVGDLPPSGYLAWHEWAAVQHKAGLRQRMCAHCCKYRFPQELSGEYFEYEGTTKGRKIRLREPICKECVK